MTTYMGCFKLYYNEEMPSSRQMKMELVNYPRNWSSLFNRKKLVRDLDAYNVWLSGIKSYGRTLRKPTPLVMMEVTKLCTATSFKCYAQLGSTTLMMLASTKDANKDSFTQHLLHLTKCTASVHPLSEKGALSQKSLMCAKRSISVLSARARTRPPI